jgi:hypothetical protein
MHVSVELSDRVKQRADARACAEEINNEAFARLAFGNEELVEQPQVLLFVTFEDLQDTR